MFYEEIKYYFKLWTTSAQKNDNPIGYIEIIDLNSIINNIC